jgi:hypothetical protein
MAVFTKVNGTTQPVFALDVANGSIVGTVEGVSEGVIDGSIVGIVEGGSVDEGIFVGVIDGWNSVHPKAEYSIASNYNSNDFSKYDAQ